MDEQEKREIPRMNEGVRMGMGKMKITNLLRRHLDLQRELKVVEEGIRDNCRGYLKDPAVSGMSKRMLHEILKNQDFLIVPKKEIREIMKGR